MPWMQINLEKRVRVLQAKCFGRSSEQSAGRIELFEDKAEPAVVAPLPTPEPSRKNR
jgi:hypothetical protein